MQKLKLHIIKNGKQIPYDYKVRDQVLVEIPRILRKLSSPDTGTYPVINLNKNGTIKLQELKKELYQIVWITVQSLHSIKIPIKYDHGGKRHNLRHESKDNT
jgi:hypothetical protein